MKFIRIGLLLFVLFQSLGCITSNLMDEIKYNHPQEKIACIESVYLDVDSNLYLNLRMLPQNKDTSNILYFKTNLAYIEASLQYQRGFEPLLFNKQEIREHHIRMMRPNYKDEPQNRISVYFTKGAYRKSSNSDFSSFKKLDIHDFQLNDYGNSISSPSLDFFPKKPIVGAYTMYDYYTFTLPEIKKGKAKKYPLVPLSVIADIVTLPVQVVGVLVISVLYSIR